MQFISPLDGREKDRIVTYADVGEEGHLKGVLMGATIQREESGIWIIRISGALLKEELDAVQAACIGGMGQDKARVLVMVEEDFRGWLGGEVWHDTTFLVEHGDRIGKIAIVGEPQWETSILMFTGAGLRPTQVKYFTRNRLAEARAWVE
ncbi:STAS/SEC14 domain-containing protein [Desulfuromonas sp. TF]|uniref:STAS/SEC14 domain-containing protein n=1 Tax=Desulfuromonas sp. TF TaxID=1232410 RepID=UPI00138B1510|nr:STAS/SEC14 domain-containing protein [Desulfuromonas sp. TF]